MNDHRDLFARLALLKAYRLDLASKIDLVPLQIRAITEALAAVIGDRNQTFPILTVSSLDKRRYLRRRECRLARRRLVLYRLNRQARIHADVALPQRPVESSG